MKTGIKHFDKFLEIFSENANGVIGTITNQPISFSMQEYSGFDLSKLETNLTLPCVLITINFTGTNDFQMQIVTATKTIATLSDLMMLGTGEVEYVPEEHNDGVQEMLNQVLGSMTTELLSEGVKASGSVSDIALVDMDTHKEVLKDYKMVELDFELLGAPAFFYMLIDSNSLSIVESIFVEQETQTAPPPPAVDNTIPTEPKQEKKPPLPQQEPVSVARASFAELDDVKPSGFKSINIDILLHIDLPVTVELGSKDMRIKEILDLGQGSVVELNKLAGDLVDLKINGKKFATGEVMVVDENYAIRIVNLISREERIRSLGPE